MCVGGHIFAISKGRTSIIYTNSGTEVRVKRGIIGLGMTWITFPEIRAFKELKARAFDVHSFNTVDETKDLRTV